MKKYFTIWIILLAFVGIGLGLLYTSYVTGQDSGGYRNQVNIALVSSPTPSPSPRPTMPPEPIAEPQTLAIPAINVNTVVEQVGNDSEGKMDVPKGVFNVGWYSLGTKPGEKGSAVMAGHLDTVTGAPAVFYYLSRLQLGDQVIVTDKNGENLTFEVTEMQSYTFDQVPLERVFAARDKARLNLITCAGVWNTGSRNYSNRLVVYTELKS